MKDIKISVIIPVYNCEKYLQDCIDSLTNQTFKELECIFVDDASTDSSLKILYENKKKYEEIIQVVEFKENRRQGAARNAGMRMARGKYIAFVDADDIVAPEMFRFLFEKAENEHAEIVKLNYARIDENQRYVNMNFDLRKDSPETRWNDEILKINEKNELDQNDRNNLYAYGIGSVWGGVFLRRLIVDNELWFPEGIVYEDNYWGTIIISFINKIFFMENVSYFYRKNLQSTVTSGNYKNFEDRIWVERSLMDYFQSDEFEMYKDGLAYRFIRLTDNSIALGLRTAPTYKMFANVLCPYLREIDQCFPNWRENRYLHVSSENLKKIERRISANKFYYVYLYYKYKLITSRFIQNLIKLKNGVYRRKEISNKDAKIKRGACGR